MSLADQLFASAFSINIWTDFLTLTTFSFNLFCLIWVFVCFFIYTILTILVLALAPMSTHKLESTPLSCAWEYGWKLMHILTQNIRLMLALRLAKSTQSLSIHPRNNVTSWIYSKFATVNFRDNIAGRVWRRVGWQGSNLAHPTPPSPPHLTIVRGRRMKTAFPQ